MLKIINSMALAIILVAGLSSCEMKDEILGKDLMSGDTGLLSLNVETGKRFNVRRYRIIKPKC